MSTRPSRAGARVARLLGLPVPYAIPVVQVDDKRGFASRENAPLAWVTLLSGAVGALENGAFSVTPTNMPGGCLLRIVNAAIGAGSNAAVAPTPTFEAGSAIVIPHGDPQPVEWTAGRILTASLPADDPQLNSGLANATAMHFGAYPSYSIDVEIPAGSSLVVWSLAAAAVFNSYLQAYVIEM